MAYIIQFIGFIIKFALPVFLVSLTNMKRSLIIFALLLFAITASAQSYSSPGIPTGTTSLTPTFRTKAATPDSLAQIWLAIGGNKFYRMLSGMDVIVFDARVVQGLGTTSSKLTFRDTLLKSNWVINPADTLHPVLTLIQKKSQDNLWLKGTGITDGRATIRFTTEKDTGDYEYGFLAGGDNNLYGLRNVRAAIPPNISWVWSVNAHNSDYTNFYRHVGMTGLTDTSTAAKILAIDANGKLFKVPYSSGGGTTPNPFTAATSGGASPGTTFDGSVARTFDYSSFGAAPAFTATGSGVILSSGNLGLGGSTTSSRTINFNTHFLEFTGTDFGGTTGTTIFQGNGFSSNITNAGGDHYGINISTAQAQLNGNNGSGNVASVNASSNHADLVFTDGSGINSISSTDNGIHIGSTIDFKAAYYDDVYLLPTGNYIPSKRQVDSIAIAKADSISGGGGGGSFLPLTFTGDNTVAIGTHAMTINADDGAGNTSSILQHPTDVNISSSTASSFANISTTGATGKAFMGSGDAAGDNPNISITPTDVIIEYQRFDGMAKAIILDSLSNNGIRVNDDSNIGLVGTTLFPVSGDPNQFVQAGNLPSTTVHTSNGLSGDGSVGTPVVLGGTISGNIDEDIGANSIDWHGDNGTYAVDNLIDNTPGGSLISSQASNSAGSHYAAVNIGITSPTGWYAELTTNKSGSGASIQLDGNTGNTTITNTLGSFGAQYGADYSTALRLNPNGIASVKVVKDMADSVKGTISAGASPGNPSGLLTFTASNGSNSTYLRNDGLHAIDSAVVASYANHPTFAQLQTKVNSYVPYSGATGNVNLGTNFLAAGASLTPLAAIHAISTVSTTPRGILSDQNSADNVGARITMRKSRGTPASPTVITTGDVLGSWTAAGYTNAYTDAGKVLVTSTGTVSNGVVPSIMELQTSNSSGTLTDGIKIDQAQALTFGAYGTGLLHSGSAGAITSSAVNLAGADVTGLLPDGNISSAATWNAKISPSDTTTAFANLVHINKAETILGPKTFNKAITESMAGITTSITTDGILVTNPTLATSSVTQQNPPVIRLTGHAWNATATAADNQGDYIMGVNMDRSNPSFPDPQWFLSARLSAAGSGAYTRFLTYDFYNGLTVTQALSVTGGVSTGNGITNSSGTIRSANFSAVSAGNTMFIGNGNNFSASGTGMDLGGSTITNSSGTYSSVIIHPTYNQTSTAAATDLTINRVQTAVGSGAQLFADFQVSGSSKFKVDNTGQLTVQAPIILKGYTVSTLPTGVTGMTAYVTDALTPASLATVVGGGASVVPVFYNGTNWIVQ